jgi:stage III sporulation protein AC
MAVDFILKLAGVGMIVSITCQVLSKAGREEQATLVSIGGIVLALLLLVERIGELFDAVFRVVGL